MQQHRDAAQKSAGHRKLRDDPRMAFVQTILQSVQVTRIQPFPLSCLQDEHVPVFMFLYHCSFLSMNEVIVKHYVVPCLSVLQLRNTPTLEELLQESENRKSLYSHNTSNESASQNDLLSANSLLLSPTPSRQGKDGLSLTPMTSTMYSAFFTTDVVPQQSDPEGCLGDRHDSQEGSQPSSLHGVSHQSISSGYVTYNNVENTINIPGRIDAQSESHGFGSIEGDYGIGGFFLHSTSHTIAKMPEIISHPPIDGEELERSGPEPLFCINLTAGEDICCNSVQEDSVRYDHLPAEKSENSHLEKTVSPHRSADFNNDCILDRSEDPVPSSDNVGFSDNPDLSEMLSTRHCAAPELHSQQEPTETEPAHGQVDEAKLSEEPYHMSLQALLKKSQEYRRRQRMLRSQARNTKIQQRTQEQPRARAEEQSLSDKENDESPYKTTVTAEGKKCKERRDTIETEETSLKKSWENKRTTGSEFITEKTNAEFESMNSTEDGNTDEKAEEETTFKNNKLNSSHELIIEPKQFNSFIQQQPLSTETSPVQEVVLLSSEQSTTSPNGSLKGSGKYRTIPAPNFCLSPVHCKTKVSIRTAEAVVGAKTSNGKTVVNTGLNEDGNLGPSHTALHSAVALMVEGNVTSVSARSSVHIDQLESNLSSLKVLISDLESTVTENLDTHSQSDSNMQSEFSFKGVVHSEQSKNDSDWCDDDRSDAEYRELFDNGKRMHEDTGPESAFSNADDLPLIMQEKKEDRLNTPLATERVKEKGTSTGVLTKSYRSQQPPAKCLLSAAQQKRIPEAFRNVSSKTPVPCNVSVLSDASNHSVEKRNDVFVQGHDSSHSPSLNQSYDVDTPSGLWLLEGPGYDMGSQGQEKNLTPESGGEDQGGVSKVKRRLLMHMMEDTQEVSADANGGAECVVRPGSSTARGKTRTEGMRASK